MLSIEINIEAMAKKVTNIREAAFELFNEVAELEAHPVIVSVSSDLQSALKNFENIHSEATKCLESLARFVDQADAGKPMRTLDNTVPTLRDHVFAGASGDAVPNGR